jgi:(2S)-methylsuccinyl-CoA dehydrogenase
LVRTDPSEPGYRGLSMLLAEKLRGTDADLLPAPGMSGTEIECCHRGMKEYEIAFDGFEVKADGLLGGAEGQGRSHADLLEWPASRTAARAVGVAQAAMEEAIAYANERVQFGQKLISFARCRQDRRDGGRDRTHARSAITRRGKRTGRRCDPRPVWRSWPHGSPSCRRQRGPIHGGNGFRSNTRFRILCDARILSIFEGAAEIQAQVTHGGSWMGELGLYSSDTIQRHDRASHSVSMRCTRRGIPRATGRRATAS